MFKDCAVFRFKDAQLICESAAELHKAGLRSVTDLDASKTMAAEIRMEIVQQKARVAITYGKLLTSMGLSMKTTLDVQTSPQGIQKQLFAESLDTLISIAESQRADLFAKKSEIAEAKERMKKANRAPLPKVRTFGQGGWLEYAKHQDSGYNYNAGISLDIPLFKGFEYTYKKKLALAEEESSVASLRELKDSIILDILIYSESAKAAQESLVLSDSYLEEATKSYEGSLESYKAGLQSVFDLIQMQRSLTNARMKKTTAKTLWLVSLAELAFATGSTL
ncbi:MAG: TolC family protein [Chlamydiota bacterium]